MTLKKRIEMIKRKRSIKKIKKLKFSEEMMKDINKCFDEHWSIALSYLPYPLGHGIEGCYLYQVFKKYGREKDFKKIKHWPVICSFEEGIHYYVDLGD